MILRLEARAELLETREVNESTSVPSPSAWKENDVDSGIVVNDIIPLTIFTWFVLVSI
jgi:hypothetical protein